MTEVYDFFKVRIVAPIAGISGGLAFLYAVAHLAS